MGSRRRSQVYARFRSAEFSFRSRNFRTVTLGLPLKRGAVSYWLVRRVVIDPDPCNLHYSNGSAAAGPAACGSRGEFSFRLNHSGDTSILAARAVVWLRPAPCRCHGCARTGHNRLSNLRLPRKALVLCDYRLT